MSGQTPEQELILLARGISEIAQTIEANGNELAGPGVTYARRLVAAADEGERGLRDSERPPIAPPSMKFWPAADRNAGFSRRHGYTGGAGS